MSRLILNEDDLLIAERQGEAIRQGGSIRIKKRKTCSPESSEDDGSVMFPPGFEPGTRTPSLTSRIDDHWITLPFTLHSQETYEFVGLNLATSTMLWNHWDGLAPDDRVPDGNEYDFLWHALNHIRTQPTNPESSLDDWSGTLRHYWGVREDLVDAILDPRFTQVRLTQDAKQTMMDTISDAYNFLLCVRAVSDQRDSKRKSVRVSGQGRAGGWQEQRRDQASATPSWYDSMERTWASLDDGVRDESILTYEAAPGSTFLYRGTIMSNLQYSGGRNRPAFLPVWAQDEHDEPRMTSDQHFETELILNTNNQSALSNNPSAPADFARNVPAWYFTPQLTVAKQYARYASNKVDGSVPVVIRFELPNALFERKLPPIHHHFSSWQTSTWKRYVWHNRRMEYIPRDLQEEVPHSTQLLIGPIARAHDTVIGNMASWQHIDQRHVYKIDHDEGEVGIQYVFPMESAGQRTDLMDNIFTQCKRNFKVIRLADADSDFA